jgi:hypothetical protein
VNNTSIAGVRIPDSKLAQADGSKQRLALSAIGSSGSNLPARTLLGSIACPKTRVKQGSAADHTGLKSRTAVIEVISYGDRASKE